MLPDTTRCHQNIMYVFIKKKANIAEHYKEKANITLSHGLSLYATTETGLNTNVYYALSDYDHWYQKLGSKF